MCNLFGTSLRLYLNCSCLHVETWLLIYFQSLTSCLSNSVLWKEWASFIQVNIAVGTLVCSVFVNANHLNALEPGLRDIVTATI